MKNTKSSEQIEEIDFTVDPRLNREVKDFLKLVNSGGPPPETLPV